MKTQRASKLLVDYPICLSLRIPWGDMDAYGHVNNTRYFRYFEDARIAYFERADIVEGPTVSEGVGPILASTSCRFKAPLVYPDAIAVGARVVGLERDRFTIDHAIASEEHQKVVAKGEAVVVAYDYREQKSTDIPNRWLLGIEKLDDARIVRED